LFFSNKGTKTENKKQEKNGFFGGVGGHAYLSIYLKVIRSDALTNCARLNWKSFFFDLFGQRKRLKGKAGEQVRTKR